MVNPNPARITDPMWKLWTDRPNLAWRLSGFYANKKAYHNTVIANKKNWPGNYSIRVPLDLVNFNRDKSRAIDLTMSDSEMVKWTERMKKSAENPADSRLDAVREFYGTLDNKTVFGLIKDDLSGPWRRSSADLTHLWHGHMGVFTKFVNNWSMLSPILSVWEGDTFNEWSVGMIKSLPRKGDSGEIVKYWQYLHNKVRKTVSPPCVALIPDGDYGDTSAAAFKDFWKKSGGVGSFTGSLITGWLALEYQEALNKLNNVVPIKPAVLSDAQLQTLVMDWMNTNIKPDNFKFEGLVKGKILL